MHGPLKSDFLIPGLGDVPGQRPALPKQHAPPAPGHQEQQDDFKVGPM